jgi:hypothetical protein
MIYQGHVENGVIVLDESVALPEGARVEIVVLASANHENSDKPFWQTALDIMASVPDEAFLDLPKDGASNLDHYLYGASKKEV